MTHFAMELRPLTIVNVMPKWISTIFFVATGRRVWLVGATTTSRVHEGKRHVSEFAPLQKLFGLAVTRFFTVGGLQKSLQHHHVGAHTCYFSMNGFAGGDGFPHDTAVAGSSGILPSSDGSARSFLDPLGRHQTGGPFLPGTISVVSIGNNPHIAQSPSRAPCTCVCIQLGDLHCVFIG